MPPASPPGGEKGKKGTPPSATGQKGSPKKRDPSHHHNSHAKHTPYRPQDKHRPEPEPKQHVGHHHVSDTHSERQDHDGNFKGMEGHPHISTVKERLTGPPTFNMCRSIPRGPAWSCFESTFCAPAYLGITPPEAEASFSVECLTRDGETSDIRFCAEHVVGVDPVLSEVGFQKKIKSTVARVCWKRGC